MNQDKGGNYGAFGLNYPVFEDAAGRLLQAQKGTKSVRSNN